MKDLQTSQMILGNAVIDPATGEKNPGMTAILAELNKGLTEANTGLTSLSSALDDANNKIDVKTLNEKLTALQSGVSALNNGSKLFSNGLSTLSDSTDTIESATTQLSDATDTINDGMNTLSESLAKFDEEGIQKIVNLVNGDVKSLESKLNRLSELSKEYDTFTKKNSKMKGETKFIVKIEA